jgi:maleamate amidohydrolase
MSQTTALVLVDVLNGFFHPDGAMWYPEVDTVVEPLHRLLDTARGSDSLVIHVADRHRPGVRDAEFDLIPEHLGRGGHDAEYFAGFEPRH